MSGGAVGGDEEAATSLTSSVMLMPGERIDAILQADKKPGDYWIDVATLDGHNSPAVLRYIDDNGVGDKGDSVPSPRAHVTIGSPTAELGCLIRPSAAPMTAAARGSAGRGGPKASGTQVDLDLSRGQQLPAHPSVPRPPRVASRELRLYLVLSSDPAMAAPSDLLGNASTYGGRLGSGGVGRVPGMNPAVEPIKGCPPLPDGGKNR